jgi:hypothetical protein
MSDEKSPAPKAGLQLRMKISVWTLDRAAAEGKKNPHSAPNRSTCPLGFWPLLRRPLAARADLFNRRSRMVLGAPVSGLAAGLEFHRLDVRPGDDEIALDHPHGEPSSPPFLAPILLGLPLHRAGAFEPVRGALSASPLCESSQLHAFSYFAHFFAKPRAIFRSVSLPVHEITT